jgi:polyhydroxybutyrate depolymerase
VLARLTCIAAAAIVTSGCVAEDPSGAETDTDAATTSTDDDDDASESEAASDPNPTSTPSEGSSEATTASPETSDDATDSAESTTTGEPEGPLPTPGCGTTDLLGELDGTIDVGGLARTYLLVQPENYDPDTLYPIIFGFHGAYDSPAGAQLGYRLEQHWEGQAIVVYPGGIPDFMTSGWGYSEGSVDHDFALALYEAIGNAMCFDQRRAFTFGYSGGGFMAHAMACFHGELFRGVGAISAGLSASDCAAPMAVFAGHGETDTTVAPANGYAARDLWLAVNGCASTSTPTGLEECVQYDGCPEGYPVIWCPHPGGHMFNGWTAEASVDLFRSLP